MLTKAFLWALYLPDFPDLSVEVRFGNRYIPDLVQISENGVPVFWGYAGRISQRKARYLEKRFRSTHLVIAKWDMSLEPFYRMIKKKPLLLPVRRR